jgi:N-acetylglucosaminyldiphosphoundecaprenol N-acetyl-beta-D-mannosaminyltransferase
LTALPAATLLRVSERVNILGVGVSAINMQQALDQIDAWVESGSKQYVCVCPVHSIMECRRSDEVRSIFNSAGMVTPDGMPVVWVARHSGHPHVGRVYGPDLMLAALGAKPHRHFFYGGGPGIAERLASAMKQRFPEAEIAGSFEPPFAPLDQLCTPQAAEVINRSRADVIWIGMSSPKQDEWMARMRPLLDAPVLIAVGAAFDFHTGTVRQAPLWMQRSGLEWVFRLAMQPRRLWRRYLIDNPWFLWELALQKSGLKRFDL